MSRGSLCLLFYSFVCLSVLSMDMAKVFASKFKNMFVNVTV